MYRNAIKRYTKMKKDEGAVIQTIITYSHDIIMAFFIDQSAMFRIQSGKWESTEN